MRRTFIFQQENSQKFWSIEINETSFTVNFGRLSTTGQIQTKEFETRELCEKEYNKLIMEKIKKGYTETKVDMVLPDAGELKKTDLKADYVNKNNDITSSEVCEYLENFEKRYLVPENYIELNKNASKKCFEQKKVGHRNASVSFNSDKLTGIPYTSEFINEKNIDNLDPHDPPNTHTSYFSWLRNDMKNYMEKGLIKIDLNKCFENIDHKFTPSQESNYTNAWNYYEGALKEGKITKAQVEKQIKGYGYSPDDPIAYSPIHISFYDLNSSSNYHILMIGGEFYLRQSNYGDKCEIMQDQVDCITVIDPDIIERIEYSFACFLFRTLLQKEDKIAMLNLLKKIRKPLCDIFRIKAFPSYIKETNEVMEYLCKKGYFEYIDWKLDYNDIIYNFNLLLKKKGMPEIPENLSPDGNVEKLVGEDAARDIIKKNQFSEYIPVMIDAQTDGLYIALFDEVTKKTLQPILNDMGFYYIE